MKAVAALVAIACALPALAHAQSAAHKLLQEQFTGKTESTAKDAVWTSPRMFKVGVIDNGSNRAGYAEYVCGEAASKGLRGITVQVIDIVKLKNTGKWVKLGEKHCS